MASPRRIVPAAWRRLAPADSSIVVVSFVPFLRPPAVSECAQVDGEHAEALADLALWGYTQSFSAQLREQLPHRIGRRFAADPHPEPTEIGGLTWTSEASLLDVWSLGVGLATFVDRLTIGRGATWADVRASLAAPEAALRAMAAANGLGAGPANPSPRPCAGQSVGAPLWVQRMIVVRSHRNVGRAQLDAVAVVLTDDGRPLTVHNNSDGTALRLGLEACAVSNPGIVDPANALSRVVATQTAIWAATIELDRLLKAELDAEDAQGLPLNRLERRSRELLRDYQRVQRFRAEVDVIDIHLAAWDKSVWNAVCTEWSLDDQMASLSVKLDAVGHLYRNLAEVLTTRQARFLNNIVLAVTTLSLATFILTAWEFVQKKFDPLDGTSVAVLAGSVVVSVVVFALAWASGRQHVGGRLGFARRAAQETDEPG